MHCGGLDSTLALLVTVKAFDKLDLDRKGIIGITMPGFGTTDRTHNNAVKLMKTLGVTTSVRSISPRLSTQHFEDIGQDKDVHEEWLLRNSQARELYADPDGRQQGECDRRLGTGDLTNSLWGWPTYNGDHMSMYGVNEAGVPKTLIRYLVTAVSGEMATETLLDIVDNTPISPELIPADELGTSK